MQTFQNSPYQQAVQLLSNRQAEAAEALLLTLLKSETNNIEALALLGHSVQMQGKTQQAVEVFERLVQVDVTSSQSYAELAGSYIANKQIDLAERAYQRALELNPDFSEAWFFLGNLLMQTNELQKAQHCFVQAERCDPYRPVFAQVQQALNNKDFHGAEKLCREVLVSHPHHSQALHTLAMLAEQLQAYEQAVNILQRGINYAPYHVSLWEALIKNLSHLGQHQDAISAAQKLQSFDPQQWRYAMLLAVELANAGQFEQSLVAYDQALSLVSDNANVHLLRGHVLKTLGKRDECEQAYRRSLALDKVNGTAYWALADLKSYRFSADDMQHMQSLLDDPAVTPAQAAQAGFALAKAYEDKHDFAKAFALYSKANQLRPDVQFAPQNYAHSCSVVKQAFTPAVLSKKASKQAAKTGPPAKHNAQAIPIFIVGLTRSGSTLLEQMLASHSCIEGTMELYCMPHTVRRAELLAKQKETYYPAVMAQLSEDELLALGQSYLQESAAFRSGSPYFIDKMPPNFHNVGFIHMILPQAIIIDARRHPLAVGLSNYKQHFARGYDFSYQLENIGFYYNQYLQMMDHWDSVLPGNVLCMQYEEVVRDTEQQIRRLLAHCGLTFEPACLDFHTNRRAVRTASSEQVRQPIYQQGIAQWRHFEPYLQPLKTALGEQTLQRFADFL
jgi:tetratricopeptide (TPR) repeat protein